MSVYSPLNLKPIPVVKLPREEVLDVRDRAIAHTGRAMAIRIAGIEVIVMARNLAELDAVFNYVEANLRGGKAELMDTLRTSGCPEVAILARAALTLDDEL